MSEEPWMKPRQTYDQRRLAQHRAWFEKHRSTLPVQAQNALAELLTMNEEQRAAINQLLLELSRRSGKDNPDSRHEAFQRDGHKVDMVFRRHRNQWEER